MPGARSRTSPASPSLSRNSTKPSAYYKRVVNVMEELVRFTVLLLHANLLVHRYSERRAALKPVVPATDLETLAVSAGQG